MSTPTQPRQSDRPRIEELVSEDIRRGIEEIHRKIDEMMKMLDEADKAIQRLREALERGEVTVGGGT